MLTLLLIRFRYSGGTSVLPGKIGAPLAVDNINFPNVKVNIEVHVKGFLRESSLYHEAIGLLIRIVIPCPVTAVVTIFNLLSKYYGIAY
jgi:hypothetical protein